MKADFESVVRDNTAWILAYVKSKISDKGQAEDIVQEIWLKAYRAYGKYTEAGKLKPWLMRICQNTVRSYYSSPERTVLISLDVDRDENDPLYNCLSDSLTPEEIYLKDELLREVLSAVNKLPDEQREIVTLRYVWGFPINETAKITGIPTGSVKSKTHYALRELKKHFGVKEEYKGEKVMECTDIKKYLFMYALGKTSAERSKEIEEHVKECEVCSKVLTALKNLIPYINVDDDVEYAHCLVHIPEIDAIYIGIRSRENHEEINKKLKELNGDISKEENMMRSVWGKIAELKCYFDHDGNELPWRIIGEDETHNYAKVDRIERVYENNWQYCMLTSPTEAEKKLFDYVPSEEVPGLYYGDAGETFNVGTPMKTMRYQAVPANAKNIKIRRGNGVIDCDTYKFAYSDRFIYDDDKIALEYTFELDN